MRICNVFHISLKLAGAPRPSPHQNGNSPPRNCAPLALRDTTAIHSAGRRFRFSPCFVRFGCVYVCGNARRFDVGPRFVNLWCSALFFGPFVTAVYVSLANMCDFFRRVPRIRYGNESVGSFEFYFVNDFFHCNFEYFVWALIFCDVVLLEN